jgi:beta-lactamase superfamily II metal-dependent hydrolase
MVQGCVRAWREEQQQGANGTLRTRRQQALFRRDFRTALRQTASDAATTIADLAWGRPVELLDWPSGAQWTRIRAGADEGFVKTEHLVEIAFVKKTSGVNAYTAKLELRNGEEVDLLWGDYVQVIERAATTCKVRARGLTGTIASNRLTSDPLLEIYVIDVGQGDGVLVRTPDGRHMVIDGGLPRSNQLTGKNAADFIDWKFFVDYGDPTIKLDALVASHSDFDHYGGLRDLVRQDDAAKDPELDVLAVDVGTFYHPGLSRWEKRFGSAPPHKDDLGPNDAGWFLRLLDDRADAQAAVVNGAPDELGGDWRDFIKDLLRRNPAMQVTRLGVERETLEAGGPLPDVWIDAGGCDVRVLAPVTVRRNGRLALKDLGDTGQNTNGHSICLRLDYEHARILLTGDLNKASMDWLTQSYGDRIGAFGCDAVKACHHGSHDISYRFLEQIEAGATIVSSGDNEGYAHPRPEIVAASATTGHLEVDRAKDKLVTPLVYMTEIERSVSVGEITHIRFANYPAGAGDRIDGAMFAQPFGGISDVALPTASDRENERAAPDAATAKSILEQAVQREKGRLGPLAVSQDSAGTRAAFHFREVRGPFGIRYDTRSVWRSRVMTKTHYGLVNVRTDGHKIICATMRETGEGWTVHEFSARF